MWSFGICDMWNKWLKSFVCLILGAQSLDLVCEENTAETKEITHNGTATEQDPPAPSQSTIQVTDLQQNKSADDIGKSVKHSSGSSFRTALNSILLTGSTQNSMMSVEKKPAVATANQNITSSLSKAFKQPPKSMSRSTKSSVNSSQRIRSIRPPQKSVKRPPAKVTSNASSKYTSTISNLFVSVLEEGKPTKPLKKSGWRVGTSPYSMHDGDSEETWFCPLVEWMCHKKPKDAEL